MGDPTDPTDPAELERIAAELYAERPAEFIGARSARAKETSDASLAKSIRQLRKPSVAAWVVNLFARERAGRLAQALQLAAELREAQADLDAATLSQLGRRRRALTNQLAAEAASLAKAQGGRVTDATLEAVRQTLSAAFFAEAAAAAVASGRLMHDLEPATDFDPDDVVGGGAASAPVMAEQPADEVGARRERQRRERALRDAQQQHERAERAVERAATQVAEARETLDRLDDQIEGLERELARVRRRRDEAASAEEDAVEHQTSTADELAAADRAVDEARAALDD